MTFFRNCTELDWGGYSQSVLSWRRHPARRSTKDNRPAYFYPVELSVFMTDVSQGVQKVCTLERKPL
ncbi:MAG TPA: hypothetical protein VGK34_04515, partial [Armatimonadota bacterium]